MLINTNLTIDYLFSSVTRFHSFFRVVDLAESFFTTSMSSYSLGCILDFFFLVLFRDIFVSNE